MKNDQIMFQISKKLEIKKHKKYNNQKTLQSINLKCTKYNIIGNYFICILNI